MDSLNRLTQQEYRVLILVAQGRRNAKIAHELCISTRTVENHLYHIFSKMGVSSRIEAVLYALQEGLLTSQKLSGISQDVENHNSYSMNASGLISAERL